MDGIIVIGKMMDTYLQHLNTEAGIPVIYLDYYNGREASDSVISNSYYGTYELTYYLYRMGHRRIAYVGTLLATESITDRYFGYQKALLELGLEQKREWVLDDRHNETMNRYRGMLVQNIPDLRMQLRSDRQLTHQEAERERIPCAGGYFRGRF